MRILAFHFISNNAELYIFQKYNPEKRRETYGRSLKFGACFKSHDIFWMTPFYHFQCRCKHKLKISPRNVNNIIMFRYFFNFISIVACLPYFTSYTPGYKYKHGCMFYFYLTNNKFNLERIITITFFQI